MSSFFDRSASAAARESGADADEDGLDGEYSKADDYPDEDDFYALLGLSSNPPPTEADIRSAYRTLSLSFHPDKQPPHLREAAQRHFTRIQEAYESILDPQKRAVYDLLGAEGVRREWGPLGAMGPGGEAQKQEVGIRAMSPDEFRQWFLKTMKKRERKAVESLVSSQGTVTLGIDASTTIQVDEDADVTFHIPSPKLTTFGVVHNFKLPFHAFEFLTATKKDDETGDQDTPTTPGDSGEPDEPVQLTLNTGVVGRLAPQHQKYQLEYPDGREAELLVPLPPALVAKDLTLGVTAVPNMGSLVGTKGIWSSHPFSLLKDSSVVVNALFLPVPALNIAVARAWQPIAGIRPFSITTNTTIKRSLLASPPSFDIQISKEIAQKKLAICSWSSGLVGWPQSLCDRFEAFGMDDVTFFGAHGETSNLQIGLVSMPKAPEQVIDVDDEDEENEEDAQRQGPMKEKTVDRAAESWRTIVYASPAGAGLSLTYARNLFSGKPADDPVRTEWSPEGYFPLPKMKDARAVRLEFTSMLGLDLSASWSIKGTRRIGEFTKMGLGVGFAENGIFLTVSWRRLGQGISIPIAICAADQAIHEAAMLTTIFSGLVYCAVEFGYVRPRDRQKRREAAARRHKELKQQVPMKREESQQAIELMADQVRKRQARESEKNGLVITKAEYGFFPSAKKSRKGFTEPRVVDVTIPVAALVDRGQLVIARNALKFQIIGFHDPAPLLPKRLKVWYTFHQEEHFVEVGDKEGIACPMRAHLTRN